VVAVSLGIIQRDASQKYEAWYNSRRTGGMQRDLSGLFFCQRVLGSARATRAVRNTWVFQTEARVVADVGYVTTTAWRIRHQLSHQAAQRFGQVITTVADRHFGSTSGSKLNYFPIGGLGCQ
jgi:hypothetical protein